MLFVHDSKVYVLPDNAIAMDGQGTVQASYKDFVDMTDKARFFGSECFLCNKVFGEEFVKIVETKAGLVWCSSVAVAVPDETRKAFGIADEVGSEFLWAWSAGKARTSHWKYRDIEVEIGEFQTLAHLAPAALGYGLTPALLEGCRELAWEALTAEQRFFLAHLNPSAAGLSTDPDRDAAYASGVKLRIERRKKLRTTTPPPHFFQSTEAEIRRAEAACSQFYKVKLVQPRAQEGYIGSAKQVRLADWSALATETSSEILKIIADEAFQSEWKNDDSAQAVAQLRLVSKFFRDALDGELAKLWHQNAEFSRRVLKGGRQTPPPIMPQLGLPAIVTLNERADTWRKLAVLRKVSGVSRKQRPTPFAFSGKVRKLSFGDEVLLELKGINRNVKLME